MNAVSGVGAAEYRYAPRSRVVFIRLYRPRLVVPRQQHYPTYDSSSAAGREALVRIKRANLAMAAAVYSARASL